MLLNAPITINTKTVSASDIQKISDKTAHNPCIFDTVDSAKKGIYPKYSDKTRLVPIDDVWYDQLRDAAK